MRRILAPLVATLFLATQSWATWSICVVNLRTGEMCVASATCVDGSDLLAWTPVILPGVGVAVTQAASPRDLKVAIHDKMMLGHRPQRIQKFLEQQFANKGLWQYAIVDLQGRSLAFTGGLNGAWAGHLTGQDGDYLYTIQGNVLAGQAVIDEAEIAFLGTPGDMSTKVMAAMEAAAAMGGDGRCSCDRRFPDSCGTPPPNFNQSATIGYLAVARSGDPRGDCTPNGCATAPFYLVLNEPNHFFPSTDPVVLLRQRYDDWRLLQQGRPDGLQSLVVPTAEHTRPGGPPVRYELDLYDIDGVGLTQGGASIALQHQPGSAGLATLGHVTDHQDGTYTVEVIPGATPGRDLFAFQVDDGAGVPATLWPPQVLLHEPGPVAPAGDPMPVPGLQALQGVRSAHVSADGLRAWMIGSLGGGFELLRAERPSPVQPFGPPTPVAMTGTDTAQITSLWVSNDELRMALSMLDSNGVGQIYQSSRADTQSPFDAPAKQAPVSSDSEESGVWLSQDELTLYFTTDRDGAPALYRANRLSPEALWFKPELVPGTDDQHAKGEAMLFAGDTRLLYTDEVTWKGALRFADRRVDDTMELRGRLPGAGAPPSVQVEGAGASADGRRAWLLYPTAATAQLMEVPLALHSLRASGHELSASAGGVLDLEIDAGPPFALAGYEILSGAPGAGMMWQGRLLPIRNDSPLTLRLHRNAGTPPWQDFIGDLDANGAAHARLDLAPGFLDPALIGRDIALVVVAEQSGHGFVSNAVVVHIAP